MSQADVCWREVCVTSVYVHLWIKLSHCWWQSNGGVIFCRYGFVYTVHTVTFSMPSIVQTVSIFVCCLLHRFALADKEIRCVVNPLVMEKRIRLYLRIGPLSCSTAYYCRVLCELRKQPDMKWLFAYWVDPLCKYSDYTSILRYLYT